MDSLLSVRIMLANTTVVVASQSENEDLFYGIRGAGFNFGIVLEATYQIYDQVPNGLHLNADFIFPVTQAKSYFQALKKKSKNLEKELSVITYVVFDPASNQVSTPPSSPAPFP
jgi:FAD/FMN-containing dehydrogenase